VTVGGAIRNPQRCLSSGTGFVGRTSSILSKRYGNVLNGIVTESFRRAVCDRRTSRGMAPLLLEIGVSATLHVHCSRRSAHQFRLGWMKFFLERGGTVHEPNVNDSEVRPTNGVARLGRRVWPKSWEECAGREKQGLRGSWNDAKSRRKSRIITAITAHSSQLFGHTRRPSLATPLA